jgi:pyruvate,water dikinase
MTESSRLVIYLKDNEKNQHLLGNTMSNLQNAPLVLVLDAAGATLEQVGGKGASLARLAAAGLPVPAGFHVTTAAYRRFVAERGLQDQILAAVARAAGQPAALESAARQIAELFARHTLPDDIADAICQAYAGLGGGDLPVAVRSSATAEDLPELSFAGQQESYLNIRGEAMLLDAIKRCWASLWTARAIDYRARHGIAPEDVSLAVVVQELVPAEAAGVLFTANPLTGARGQVLINAAWGLGEAIVGGLVTPDTVVVDKASRTVTEQQVSAKDVMTVQAQDGTREAPVPAELREQPALSAAQAAELAGIGAQIEGLYGQPVDIEWARRDGQVFVVQARPITTLREPAPDAEVWNDSLKGDYLWTSANVGEAVPDVMTPSTWSLIQIFIAETMSPLYFLGLRPIGNIGGRFYFNLSLTATLLAMFGLGRKFFVALNQEAFGRIPDDLGIPLVPIARWQLLGKFLPVAVRLRRRIAANQKKLPAFLAAAPARCEALRVRIEAAASAQELIELWHAELLPFFQECCQMLEAGARRDGSALVRIRGALRKLVDDAEVNALLSGLHGSTSPLASLGPLLGLAQLARGEIDRATFARQYGHRGPHEFEVSTARPAEDPGWIDQQLAGLRDAPLDVDELLARQKAAQAAAWERFRRRYPRRAAAIQRRIGQAAAAFRDREGARSEVVRVFWALRAFVLRAGELTRHGEKLFFLSVDEILAVLAGDDAPLAAVAPRRAAYARYSALPPYPARIRGRFEPFAWAADPNRRSDVFDATRARPPASAAIAGFPGADGVVEGRARVLATADEGEQLQVGEILVTTVTNVGWTPLFPRAAAIVTDIGAPLSHAAIVARELGIPAVVGCGNATMRLHTGDRVRVNGGQGTVELLG